PAVRLRPRVGGPRAARRAPAVGRGRPAAVGEALRPAEAPRLDRPAAPAPGLGQAGGGRPPWAVGRHVAARPGASAGGGGWGGDGGGYGGGRFRRRVARRGVTVVGRLRRDAALRGVPGPRRAGQRGRPRVYGEARISLAKRAGQRRGWATGAFELYGKPVVKRYKTFVATWRPSGGPIRVVLVDEPHGWVAYFCTDPAATAADVTHRGGREVQPGGGVQGL